MFSFPAYFRTVYFVHFEALRSHVPTVGKYRRVPCALVLSCATPQELWRIDVICVQ